MILHQPEWLRFQRGAEHLHQLGPRATAELLAEIGKRHGITGEILDRLDCWRRLRPEMLAAVLGEGQQFPAAVQAVPRGRPLALSDSCAYPEKRKGGPPQPAFSKSNRQVLNPKQKDHPGKEALDVVLAYHIPPGGAP